MFYAGETVRSAFHGLAEVVMTGEDPVVRLLGGLEIKLPGSTLTVVPPEEHDGAIADSEAREAWLDRRIYGVEQPRPRPPQRPQFDLEAAMMELPLPLPPVRHYSLDPGVLYFESEATVVSDAEAAVDLKPTRVTAVRMEEQDPPDSTHAFP